MEIEDQEQDILFDQEAINTFISVKSVNGKTGTVVLTTSDIENTSDYQTGTQVESAISTAIADKQDKLTPGDGIDITNNVISNTRDTVEWGKITGDITDQTDLQNKFSSVEGGISEVKTDVNTIDTAINKTVLSNVTITGSTSTDTLSLDSGKVNIKTGATSSVTVPFPVASATTAGVMNSATYQGLQQATDITNGLLNGAVAVNGLPEEPTQAQLTTAWKTATGRTELMNRAVLYDIANSKLWTYYTNTSTWYSAAAGGGSVDVQPWTNTQAGIVKGSTEDGQIFAETDGTGSVNGWDEIKSDIENKVDDVQVDGESVVENNVANIDLSGKMDKNNAVGTGAFSMNRRGKQDVGAKSVTLGEGCDAGGEGAVSMGYFNKVQGSRSAAIGRNCDANNGSCYVVGKNLVTKASDQTIIGNYNANDTDSNSIIIADGTGDNDTHNAIKVRRTNGTSSIAMNGNTTISGTASTTQGFTVGGNTVLRGNLNVSGTSTFSSTATFNGTLNAKYSGTTYNVGSKLAELSKLKEAKFSSKLMWSNSTLQLKPGMFFLFPSDCDVTITIFGRQGLKTNPEQTHTLNVQDLCGGICTELGQADDDGKDSNYWRMFIGYRTGTLSFDSDTYYIHKDNLVAVRCNVAGGRWGYFISK